MSACADAVTTLTTVLASGLFLISEVLPYVKSVKGNGIIEIIINILKTKLNKDKIKVDEETPIQSVTVNHAVQTIQE